MKILKISLSIITLFILLVITAVIVVPQLIDPNNYKDQIAAVIKKQTTMETSFTGDLHFSFFPWLGVTTGKVTLSQPQAIRLQIKDVPPLADISTIDIKVKLIPLLSRKIDIDTVRLQRPEITLITTPTGKNSLDFINTADTTNTTANSASKNNAAAVALTIAGVNLNQGQVLLDNRQTNERIELTKLTINSGDVLSGRAVPLTISGIFSSSSVTPISFSLNTIISANVESKRIAVNNLQLSVNHEYASTKATIKTISYQYPDTVDIKDLLVSGAANNIPFTASSGDINADLSNHHIDLPKLTLNALDIEWMSKLSIKHWDKMPLIAGHLQSSGINANKVLQTLGIDYQPAQPTALNNVAFISDFNGTPKGVSLQNMDITLDDSSLKGSLSLTNFSSPQYRFDFSLDTLAIDDYLPREQSSANTKDTQTTINAAEVLVAPIALLNNIYANGIFRAESLQANNIQLNKVLVSVASHKDSITITPSLSLYSGTLKGIVNANRAANPTLNIKATLNNVQLEPLLIAADITDQLSGVGNVDANITAMTTNGVPSTKGTIKISANDGAIKGIDIKKILDDGQATIDKLRGKDTQTTNKGEDKTRFAAMTATLLLNNDIISNNDLYAEAPASRIGGIGTANLATRMIDYIASVTVVNTNSGQGGRNIEDLKGVTIPVSISGPFDDPKIKPDYSAALKAISNKLLNAEKEKLNAKLAEEKAKAREKIENEKARLKQQAKEKAAEELGVDKGNSTEELKNKLKEKLFNKLF